MKNTNAKGHNQNVGRWGEDCAAKFLINQGLEIVERNIRTPEGEIDLIARQGDLLLFVEVKTRSHNKDGYPEEAVTEQKMEHMTGSAEYYLEHHPECDDHWRIDVIAVTGSINLGDPLIEWFEDAA